MITPIEDHSTLTDRYQNCSSIDSPGAKAETAIPYPLFRTLEW
jgi:hypothetical protein